MSDDHRFPSDISGSGSKTARSAMSKCDEWKRLRTRSVEMNFPNSIPLKVGQTFGANYCEMIGSANFVCTMND